VSQAAARIAYRDTTSEQTCRGTPPSCSHDRGWFAPRLRLASLIVSRKSCCRCCSGCVRCCMSTCRMRADLAAASSSLQSGKLCAAPAAVPPSALTSSATSIGEAVEAAAVDWRNRRPAVPWCAPNTAGTGAATQPPPMQCLHCEHEVPRRQMTYL
jgi:hypothetical protein